VSEPTQPSNEKGGPDVGLCPRLLAPLRCGIDRGNVPHTLILTEAGLLAVVFRKSVGPRDAAWGPVGPSVGQWTCVSRPEATGRLYHSRQSSGPLGRQLDNETNGGGDHGQAMVGRGYCRAGRSQRAEARQTRAVQETSGLAQRHHNNRLLSDALLFQCLGKFSDTFWIVPGRLDGTHSRCCVQK
jgi:hypothetical protein